MADSYSFVKGGKLKLKGKKHKSHKKHKSKKREHGDVEDQDTDDTLRHGSWREIDNFDDITGQVGVEVSPMRYMIAEDNGLFKMGHSHEIGEGPDPEEILLAIRVNDTKIALKSGYDKYLSVKTDGMVAGRSDAIGGREQWEPVFQDGKMALLGCNSCFMSVDSDNGSVVCTSKTAGDSEMISIRTCNKKEKKQKTENPEEQGTMKTTEVNYVKKFQSFQDRRLRVNEGKRSDLRVARTDGSLHEALLDRRAKMKSDRYCK